jgi:hypothetical protein
MISDDTRTQLYTTQKSAASYIRQTLTGQQPMYLIGIGFHEVSSKGTRTMP